MRHLPCGQAVFTARTLKSTVCRKYLEVIASDNYDGFTIVAEGAGKLPFTPIIQFGYLKSAFEEGSLSEIRERYVDS